MAKKIVCKDENIQKYQWWGQKGEPPENLKTKKQLSSMGLRPKKAVGVIHTDEYDCYLYDPDDPESSVPKRKASAAQLAALEKGRRIVKAKSDYNRWLKIEGDLEFDRIQAVQWARKVLANKEGYSWAILDTETTGLSCAEIVEVTIIDIEGNPLINTLVKPKIPIPIEAINIHGITNEMVENAPTFPDIYADLSTICKENKLLIYNADFDVSILHYCCEIYSLPILKYNLIQCLMEWYAQWFGDWNSYYKSYKWQPLCGGHRALSDCQAALALLKEMAQDSDQIRYPDWVDLDLIGEN